MHRITAKRDKIESHDRGKKTHKLRDKSFSFPILSLAGIKIIYKKNVRKKEIE